MFIEALDVDDVIAHLLVTEGFTTVEEVAYVPLEELAGIEGFDEEVADELQEPGARLPRGRAGRAADAPGAASSASADELAAIEALTPAMLVTLGEAGVKTLDDLADLAGDELIDAASASCATSTWRAERQRHHHGRARPLVRR